MLGQPPIRPEPTKALLITAISGLSMFFLSVFFIVILELLDTSLRTPAIFRKATHMPVLAGLGKIDLHEKQLSDYFPAKPGAEREQTPVSFIENLRKIRYEIEQSGKKILLFTSLRPGEGKTTVIEALAHAFSLSRKKLLLIDANFSNNALTRDFSAKPALETFSMTGQDANGRIWGITTVTGISRVDVIGCNEGNYTPSEVLPKNNLLANLDKLQQHYDLIFLEGAALNDHADSKELSRYTEGIVLVCSAQNRPGEPDRESLQYLQEKGDQFIGTVLNKVDEQNLEL
jgi:Mrp family chromosome partitioning ATPase